MKAQQARELGRRIAALVQAGRPTQGYSLLAPLLAERTPFRLLDLIGAAVGAGPRPETNAFLERIAADRTEGGWVVIASALRQQIESDPQGAFDRGRRYIAAADVWYGADILGERVPGPALVAQFQPSLERLAPWRADQNRWVRRAVGVSVHFWAKRSRGKHPEQAQALLEFLSPMFEEWEMDAVKGVGWGLKTLGKYYPRLMADWLEQQLAGQHRHRALMLHKALTYLTEEQKARIRALE
ncbi:MAG: DNA alkylation repair protein [Chloroflexia bacterium]|nr:DNA alkylation repair protein [Chloroflexia bacterium]